MTLRTRASTARRADDAFAVHRALLMAESQDPALRDNPEWTIHRQDAFERFAFALGEHMQCRT